MGLGNRTARSHDTRAIRRAALRSEDYSDFSVRDRVRTVDGIGHIVAIEDGPFPQTEHYRVTLEGGMGGGLYNTGQILGKVTDTQASVERTARDDYPELGSILSDRPDIAKGASRIPFVHEARGPEDLGPDWTHHPQKGYEPEQYLHHDTEHEATYSISKVPDGKFRSRWQLGAKSWCGTEHQQNRTVRSIGNGDAVRSPGDVLKTRDWGKAQQSVRDHADLHHDGEGCSYDPGKSYRENTDTAQQAQHQRAMQHFFPEQSGRGLHQIDQHPEPSDREYA